MASLIQSRVMYFGIVKGNDVGWVYLPAKFKQNKIMAYILLNFAVLFFYLLYLV